MRFDFQAFLFWIAIDLVAWGLYFVVGFLQNYFQGYAIRKLNNQVRHDLYLTLLNKSHQEYCEQNTGEYISWCTNNIKQIEKLAWNPFFNCIGRFAQVVWSMYVLLTLHWTLMIASIISAIIMFTLPKLFQHKIECMSKECSNAEALSVSQLKDLLSGFEVLRCFNRRKQFLQQGDNISDQIEKSFFRLGYTKTAVDAFAGFISISIQFLSNILIVVLAFKGIIIPSVLAGGSNLIAGVTNGLSIIANLRLSISASKPYFENITLNADKEQTVIHKELKLRESIEFEHVSFQYNDAPILNNINFHFQIGKKYALVGPSGCGKSTLLKILLGWLPEYSGKILLDGKDAHTYSIEELQKQIGYIEQNVFLFNTTIRDNITLGENFSKEELDKALLDSALFNDLLAIPDGLNTIVGEEGRNLSGGQKQRIAIARALIYNRSILLVNEGTSALDQLNADIVERSLLSNPSITLILVSHHLTEERKK